MSLLLKTKIYKQCVDKCLQCKQCKDFHRIVSKIDLKMRSKLERQRNAELKKSID